MGSKFWGHSLFKHHIMSNHDNVSVERWYCPISKCVRFFSSKKSCFKHLNRCEKVKTNSGRGTSSVDNVNYELEVNANFVHENCNTLSDVDNTQYQPGNFQSIINETQFSFLKIVVDVLSDISISRFKALQIINRFSAKQFL